MKMINYYKWEVLTRKNLLGFTTIPNFFIAKKLVVPRYNVNISKKKINNNTYCLSYLTLQWFEIGLKKKIRAVEDKSNLSNVGYLKLNLSS